MKRNMNPPKDLKRYKGKGLALALLAAGLVTFLPSASFGQGSTLERDAYTLSTSASTNFGAATIVRVSGSGSGSVANGYFRHHLTTSLPSPIAGSNVAKATVKFYVSKVTTPGTIDVYLISGTWAESTIKYSTAPALGAFVV